MDSVVANNQGTPSLKQKAWRRKTVLGAAEVYFLEVGYEAFSMNQLAGRARVGRGTPLLHDKRRIVDNTLCAESDSMELCFYKLPSETNVEQGLCEGVIPYCPRGLRFLALAQQA